MHDIVVKRVKDLSEMMLYVIPLLLMKAYDVKRTVSLIRLKEVSIFSPFSLCYNNHSVIIRAGNPPEVCSCSFLCMTNLIGVFPTYFEAVDNPQIRKKNLQAESVISSR